MHDRPVSPSGSALIALVFLLLAAPAAFTQQHRPGHQMQDRMPGHSMMMAMMEGPELALRERERLGLSAAQVRRLESVQERVGQAHHAPMERMQEVHRELAAAMNNDLDEARARAALQRMAVVHTEIGLALLRARDETRSILTAEQRERLVELGQQHTQQMPHMMSREHAMHPGMMSPGMMMLCPMMQHGREGAPHRHDS